MSFVVKPDNVQKDGANIFHQKYLRLQARSRVESGAELSHDADAPRNEHTFGVH
jgi:hypothetical protein